MCGGAISPPLTLPRLYPPLMIPSPTQAELKESLTLKILHSYKRALTSTSAHVSAPKLYESTLRQVFAYLPVRL